MILPCVSAAFLSGRFSYGTGVCLARLEILVFDFELFIGVLIRLVSDINLCLVT